MHRGGEQPRTEPPHEPLTAERIEQLNPAQFTDRVFDLIDQRRILDRTDRRLAAVHHEEAEREFRQLHHKSAETPTGFDYQEAKATFIKTMRLFPYLVATPESTDHFDHIDAMVILPRAKAIFGIDFTVNPLREKEKREQAETAGLRAPQTLAEAGLGRDVPFARFVIAPPQGADCIGWCQRFHTFVREVSVEREAPLVALSRLSKEDRAEAAKWIKGSLVRDVNDGIATRMKVTGFRSRSHADQVGRELNYLRAIEQELGSSGQ